MPADRKTRFALRDALIAYMRGDIRTFTFDDLNSACYGRPQAADQSVLEISRTLWTIHDDFVDHPISVTFEGWETLKRVVAFLATDLELGTVTGPLSPSWPFRDATEWLSNEHLSLNCGLPEYDAQTHGRRMPQRWWIRIPTPIAIGVIIAVLALIVGFAFTK